ncbi:MAG: tetratricopeptide repeat protein [Treponemataceae bacterium]
MFFYCSSIYALDFPEEIENLINDDFASISDEQLIAYFIHISFETERFDELFSFYATNIGVIDEAVVMNASSLTSENALAEFLLQEMHNVFFQKYNLHSYTAGEIKDNGLYNCVSSSILYSALLLRYGISSIVPIETPDHVFISVEIDNESVDIETTNKIGFDPGSKKDFIDEFGKITGFAYVPPSNYRNRQQITIKKLVSLVSHNKSTYYNAKKNYLEAFFHATIVKHLRNDEKGDSDYNGTLTNLISSHIQKKEYDMARDFLLEKMSPDIPQYIRLHDAILFGLIEENYKAGFFASAFDKATYIKSADIRSAAINNICGEIVRTAEKTKDYQMGISILELAEVYGLDNSFEYKKNRYIIVNNISVHFIKSNQFDEAKTIFYTEWDRNILSKAELQKIFKGVILSEGNHYFNKKNYDKTITTTKEGLLYLPNDSHVLHNLRNAYIQQLSVLDNTNKEDYSRVIAEARSFFPREKYFQ